MACPKCGSKRTTTYRHPNAKVWCMDCEFVLRDEGATEYNSYTPEEELKEADSNSDECGHETILEETEHDCFPYGDTVRRYICATCGEVFNCVEEVIKARKKDQSEELKEAPYNPDDINMVLLTEEHLQRVVREAVRDGVEEYFKKVGAERLLRDMGIGKILIDYSIKE